MKWVASRALETCCQWLLMVEVDYHGLPTKWLHILTHVIVKLAWTERV